MLGANKMEENGRKETIKIYIWMLINFQIPYYPETKDYILQILDPNESEKINEKNI